MKILKFVTIFSLLIWVGGMVTLLYGGDGAMGASWIARYCGMGIFGWAFGLVILSIISKIFLISLRVNVAFLIMFSIFYIIFPVEWFLEAIPGGNEFLNYMSQRVKRVEMVEVEVGVVLMIILRDILRAITPDVLFIAPIYLFCRLMGKRVFAGAR